MGVIKRLSDRLREAIRKRFKARARLEGPPSQAGVPCPRPPRDRFFVQVGLDFGTSYCKCVCRDVMVEQAWVHLPEQPADTELPFLIPSALQVCNGNVVVGDPSSHYHPNGLPHIKRALVHAALEDWNAPVLEPFKKVLGHDPGEPLMASLQACAVYLLAGILGGVRKDIRKRLAGFGNHPEDYMAVNLAVPVADAERPQVNSVFQRVLETAYKHADRLEQHTPLALADLDKFTPQRKRGMQASTESDADAGPCYIYPEVSAGVQGFVRSRLSKSGVYLFSDAGAATVDQSVFILYREQGKKDSLTYLHAAVLPLGSSQIEHRAASKSGDLSWENLEHWRRIKENGLTRDGSQNWPLRFARNEIGSELKEETAATLFGAKRKLDLDAQLHDVHVMFGGGGHTEHPYERSVMNAFDDERVFGSKKVSPPIIRMPVPNDLEPAGDRARWMSRLWVAYGLSFHKSVLADHMYPSQVAPGKRVVQCVNIAPIRKEDV